MYGCFRGRYDAAEPWLHDCWARASRLLEHEVVEWAVEEAAQGLVWKGTLTSREIRQIIRRCRESERADRVANADSVNQATLCFLDTLAAGGASDKSIETALSK